MAITATGFLSTLAGLTITGVNERATPPQQVNAGALPIGYPRLPESEAGAATFTSVTGLRSLRCEYVILINPLTLSRNSTNHGAAATAMDNLHTALATEAAANNQIDSWAMRMDVEEIGDTAYWSVVATVEASE